MKCADCDAQADLEVYWPEVSANHHRDVCRACGENLRTTLLAVYGVDGLVVRAIDDPPVAA